MAHDSIVEINDQNFEAEVLTSAVPVLLDFWAEWCGPCKAIGPTVDKIAQRFAGQLKVGKCNVDNSQMIPARFGIKSIPTILLFKGGKVIDQIVGGVTEAKLASFIERALK